MDKGLKAHFFKNQKTEWGKCQWPAAPHCTTKPIRAHSIQNRGTLGGLSENGHVVMIDLEIDGDTGPVPVFKEVGRNKATTFTGLCAKHDQELFRPIDTSGIDVQDPEHTFLVAYRSILREFVAMANRTNKIQAAYKELVRRGFVSDKEPSEPGLEATGSMIESWGFFRHMCLYHDCFIASDWGGIEHFALSLQGPPPGFACSGVYAIRNNMSRTDWLHDYQCAALNVFPTENGAELLISYPQAHSSSWAQHTAELAQGEDSFRKYVLSKLVLRHCENFVIRPSVFNSWSKEKQEAIIKYFCTNLFISKHDYEDADLYLF